MGLSSLLIDHPRKRPLRFKQGRQRRLFHGSVVTARLILAPPLALAESLADVLSERKESVHVLKFT